MKMKKGMTRKDVDIKYRDIKRKTIKTGKKNCFQYKLKDGRKIESCCELLKKKSKVARCYSKIVSRK